MANPEIKASDDCDHENQFEYWHENDKCGLDDCEVNECDDCGMFATSCGMEEAEEIPEADQKAGE